MICIIFSVHPRDRRGAFTGDDEECLMLLVGVGMEELTFDGEDENR
jgi:hypothetical protein